MSKGNELYQQLSLGANLPNFTAAVWGFKSPGLHKHRLWRAAEQSLDRRTQGVHNSGCALWPAVDKSRRLVALAAVS
jgi:hypothetical protein